MHTLEMDEGDRQLVLMALAILSLTFPGWDDATNRVALRIDNDKDGRAEMFDALRALRRDSVKPMQQQRKVPL